MSGRSCRRRARAFTSTCREIAVWNDEETTKLIELWGEEDIQAMLEGCKRNKAVYEKIAREMETSGYERSAVQCRERKKSELSTRR